MPHGLGAHQRQQNVLVLLSLEAIHRGDVGRVAKEWVWATPLQQVDGTGGPQQGTGRDLVLSAPYLLYDVTDEVLLAIVCGQNGDVLGRIATEAHVLIHRHHILGLPKVLRNKEQVRAALGWRSHTCSTYLVEKGTRLHLPSAFKVFHINHLVLVGKAGIRGSILLRCLRQQVRLDPGGFLTHVQGAAYLNVLKVFQVLVSPPE